MNVFAELDAIVADAARAEARNDVLAEVDRAAGLAPPLPPSDRPRILVLRFNGHRTAQDEPLNTMLATVGAERFDMDINGHAPDLGVEAWLKANGPVVATLRWEEHAGLWGEGDRFRKFARWSHERGIRPLYIDFAYFGHFGGFIFDQWTPEGEPSIVQEWPALPDAFDPAKLTGKLAAHWRKVSQTYAEAKTMPPLVEGEYVAAYCQATSPRSRLECAGAQDWLNRVHAIYGDHVAFKLSPVSSKELKWPEGARVFAHEGDSLLLNARLAVHAKYCLVNSSSVTNEFFIAGLPVVCTGRSWYHGLGVFDEPPSWDSLKDWTPQPINQQARNRYANWWTRRQCLKGEDPLPLLELLVGSPHRGKRAVFILPVGLGNILMAVPAMRALSELTGRPIEATSPRGANRQYMDWLGKQPFIAATHRRPLDYSQFDVVSSVAFRHYIPGEVGKAIMGRPTQFDQLPHETERDMTGVRALGYKGETPAVVMRCDAEVKHVLPSRYIVAAMDCSSSGAYQSRRWPRWQEFAAKWQDPPLVFVGVNKVDWIRPPHVDLIGQTSIEEAAQITRGAEAFVGIDCGMAHVAGAMRCPGLVLYGPTESEACAPWGANMTALTARPECGPCFMTSRWQACKGWRCMALIECDRVAAALRDCLGRTVGVAHPETWHERLSSRSNRIGHGRGDLAQSRPELEMLWPRLAALRPKTVVEIGVKEGWWLYYAASVCQRPALFVGVDIEQRPQMGEVKRLLANEGHVARWVIGQSELDETAAQVYALLPPDGIDLLHIDGNHHRGNVLADWHLYASRVRSGGLIVFHDAVNTREEVRYALSELSREERIKRWTWLKDPKDNLGIAIAELR